MSYSRKHKRNSRKLTGRKLIGGESRSAIFSHASSATTKSGGRKRREQKGGVSFPMSFANVPIRTFYPQNDFNNDPAYLTVASRNTGSFYGGTPFAKKSRSLKNKKQRGGSWFGPNQFPTIPKIPAVNLYDSSNPPKE